MRLTRLTASPLAADILDAVRPVVAARWPASTRVHVEASAEPGWKPQAIVYIDGERAPVVITAATPGALAEKAIERVEQRACHRRC